MNFADAVVPIEIADGKQWILPNAPTPSSSLQIYRNGLLQREGDDYAAAGFFVIPKAPRGDGETVVCFYRF
jgi:hypothetical protein